MNLRFKFICAGICLLLAVSSAYPKLALSTLFISGGSLSRPLEVTDAELLQSSNPWFGTFIPQWNGAPGNRIAGPPETATRYEISFYVASTPSKPPHIVYVAYYAFDSATHLGFLYLPGQNEQWYFKNAEALCVLSKMAAGILRILRGAIGSTRLSPDSNRSDYPTTKTVAREQ